MAHAVDLDYALGEIQKLVREADGEAGKGWWQSPLESQERESDRLAGYYIEEAFERLLVLAEAVQLPGLLARVKADYADARREGLTKTEMGIEEPYLY